MTTGVPEDSSVPENMKGDLNDPSEADAPDEGQHVREVERSEETVTETPEGERQTEKVEETVKEQNSVDGDDPRSRNYEKDL